LVQLVNKGIATMKRIHIFFIKPDSPNLSEDE